MADDNRSPDNGQNGLQGTAKSRKTSLTLNLNSTTSVGLCKCQETASSGAEVGPLAVTSSGKSHFFSSPNPPWKGRSPSFPANSSQINGGLDDSSPVSPVIWRPSQELRSPGSAGNGKVKRRPFSDSLRQLKWLHDLRSPSPPSGGSIHHSSGNSTSPKTPTSSGRRKFVFPVKSFSVELGLSPEEDTEILTHGDPQPGDVIDISTSSLQAMENPSTLEGNPCILTSIDDKQRSVEDSATLYSHHVTSGGRDSATGHDNKVIAPDLFELLEKLQTSRLDDQRCVLPAYFTQTTREESPKMMVSSGLSAPPSKELLEEVLRRPAPYPMVVLPKAGGYWSDDGSDPVGRGCSSSEGSTASASVKLEIDETARCYRRFFMAKEHHNFMAYDEQLGPVLLSVKHETLAGQDHLRLILRLRTGTLHEVIPATCLGDQASPYRMAKLLCEELSTDRFAPVAWPRASPLIAAYDEHVLVTTFKFGLLHQRYGQITEEDIFGNNGTSAALDEFLDLLGTRINLLEHKGYKGGLDTQYGQTGLQSLFEVYKEREIMFHVAPLLPYTDNDPQQLQRKRHIGNDIVAVVFQENNTPFAPDMIASHFLHAFIVVQPIDPCTPNSRYRVTVTARDDVPFFGPTLPHPDVFRKGPELKEFLLTKLLNGENACYKAQKFARLGLRTRTALLTSLVDDLHKKSMEFLNLTSPLIPAPGSQVETPTKSENSSGGGGGARFIDTVRKALSSSRAAKNQEQNHNHSAMTGPKKSGSGTLQWHTGSNDSTLASTYKSSSLSSQKSQNGPKSYNSMERCLTSLTVQTGLVTPSSSPSLDTPPPRTNRLNAADSDDSSLNSIDLEGHLVGGGNGSGTGSRVAQPPRPPTEDSDTGMESLSSTETPATAKRIPSQCTCYSSNTEDHSVNDDREELVKQVEFLQQEVTKLKCDKLDLLRQNVSCQRDIKRLKEREIQLQSELLNHGQELQRLRQILQVPSPFEGSPV